MSDPHTTDTAPLPSLRILIIDDEEQIRLPLRAMLEFGGHTVEEAGNGTHGLELASARPDLILCDVNMPGLSGYAVLEELRRRPPLQEIPFIFLTGQDSRQNMRQGMTLGADDYLFKPFSIEEVQASIAACYRKHAGLRARLRHYEQRQRSEDRAPWAHELLTPIHGVPGFAAMLEAAADTISREDLRWMASGIRKSGERQLALAKKILRHHELAALLDESAPPIPCATPIEPLITGARTAAAQAGRPAEVNIEATAADVNVPPALLEVVGFELVENACKFSQPGTRVAVRGSAVPGGYVFEVMDAGIGMSPEERSEIAPFRQFGRDKREQQGMGLGLSLVRDITNLCGGSLQLAAGENEIGLRVRVELPAAD